MTTPFDENIDTQPDTDDEDVSASDTSSVADEQYRKLQQERDSLYERLARATADYQNSRKRLETEMDSRLQYANSSLIKSLLPVIDNFERALAVDLSKADSASILKGLQVVHDQWLTVLKNQSVEVINPQPGTPFDPSQHEALMQQPSDKYKEPTVTQLLQKGYALHGRTLRPASVAVSKSN
jgi:molecular chaperone GrpE